MLRTPSLWTIRICALLVCLLSCGLATAQGIGPESDSLRKSAVRIRYERKEGDAIVTGHGTAFGVDLSRFGCASKRLLLSAAHNVLDGKGGVYATLKIEIESGSRSWWSQCRVISYDAEMDLCLVEASEDLPYLATLAPRDAKVGQSLVLAGSPRGVPVATFPGVVTHKFHNGTVRSAARVTFDHGDSGGPIFAADSGRVIGVAVAGVPKDGDLDHTIGLFVPVCGIEHFLESCCPLPAIPPSTVTRTPAPAASVPNVAVKSKKAAPAAKPVTSPAAIFLPPGK